MKEIALLGPTASGKSSLSIKLANKYNCIILSLDSLSIYKEIDIASAKPTRKEMGSIVHFGINEIYPDQNFCSADFFQLYKKAKEYALNNNKNLIIVGGTGFYLKSLIGGLSKKPHIGSEIKNKINSLSKADAYRLIFEKDIEYAKKISPNDSYRIEKWLEIYFTTSLNATDYFKKHKKEKINNNIKIYEIEIEKDILKNNITLRTNEMIKNGLVEEVFYLEKKYTRKPKAMGAIGIKETLEYLDGKIDIYKLPLMITASTLKLAKRQKTFNQSQFENLIKDKKENLFKIIGAYLS